jgi:hypothetical protein
MSDKRQVFSKKLKKPRQVCRGFCFFCGERGIRTPGPVTVNGFQDRRIKPLCHLSGAKLGVFLKTGNRLPQEMVERKIRPKWFPSPTTYYVSQNGVFGGELNACLVFYDHSFCQKFFLGASGGPSNLSRIA